MLPKLFVLVSGFGNPHWDHKIQILRNNIHNILYNKDHAWDSITIFIASYQCDKELPDDIKQHECITILTQQGIVGDFIRMIATPEFLRENNFDYVLLLLDDVELTQPIDWRKVLTLKTLSSSDIVSPCLSLDSKVQYPYMVYNPSATYTAQVTSVCEYFCYFIDSNSFIQKYYPLLDKDNPWLWGLDLILFEERGIKVCMVNRWIIKHHYKGECYSSLLRNPREDFEKYIKKLKYEQSTLAQQRPVLYYISMEHLGQDYWIKLFLKSLF